MATFYRVKTTFSRGLGGRNLFKAKPSIGQYPFPFFPSPGVYGTHALSRPGRVSDKHIAIDSLKAAAHE